MGGWGLLTKILARGVLLDLYQPNPVRNWKWLDFDTLFKTS